MKMTPVICSILLFTQTAVSQEISAVATSFAAHHAEVTGERNRQIEPQTHPCEYAGSLSCGAFISGSWGGTDCDIPLSSGGFIYVDFLSFDPIAGQPITVTVTWSASFQVLATIQLASDGSILTSKLGASPITLTYTPTSSQRVAIGVGPAQAYATGNYTLNLVCGSQGGGQCPVTFLTLPSRTFGSITTGDCRLENSTYYYDMFSFRGKKGVPVTVTYAPSGYGPYFDISSLNDDFGIWKQAQGGTAETTLTPEVTAEYKIFISTYSPGATGSYLLVVDEPAATLVLFDQRFQAVLSARDHRSGRTASGQAIPENDLFGYFSIPGLTGDASNPEVFVKIIDGRAVNGRFWVFYGGLTDLEFSLTVLDTFTNQSKVYSKAGGSACGAYDTDAF